MDQSSKDLFKPTPFKKAKLAYLQYSDAEPEKTNITLQKNPVFFDNFIKFSCLSCDTVHILGFSKQNQALPTSVPCALCQKAISIENFRQRRTRRDPLSKVVKYQQDDGAVHKANVVDFSPAGLRLSSKKRLSPDGKVKIFCKDFNAVGEAVWMKKMGSFVLPVFEVGIRFEEFNATGRDVLLEQKA